MRFLNRRRKRKLSPLAKEKIKVPKSMFGADKTLRFTQKDKVDLHEL